MQVNAQGVYNFRCLREDDIQAMLAICRESLSDRQVNINVLREKTFSSASSREFGLGCFSGSGALVGFVWAALFKTDPVSFVAGPPIKGGIRLLGMSMEHSGGGIGSLLLARAEEFLVANGARMAWVYALPGNYLLPGIPVTDVRVIDFIRSRGYEHACTAIGLIASTDISSLDLHHAKINLELNGFTLRYASQNDSQRVFAFVSRSFEHMEDEVFRAYRSSMVPGVLCFQKDTLVGFSVVDANNRGLGTTGPMGVLKEYRQKGIARALVLYSIALLGQLGYTECQNLWLSRITCHIIHQSLRQIRTQLFGIYQKDLEKRMVANAHHAS